MKRLLSLFLALGLSCSLALPAAALEVEDAKDLLRTYYVDELPEGFEEMTDLDEILDAINDPYTGYLSPEEYGQLQSFINGDSVEGIGVSISTVFENGYKILSILPDSPALEAGLDAGDVILAVDGHTLTAEDDPTALIPGKEDTPVTLTIQTTTGRVYDITLKRKFVSVPIVTHEMVGDALLITCDSFGDSTARLVRKALEECEADASLCIMDLRGNPGGTSTAAAGTAGWFLGGTVISYFRDADDTYNFVYTTPKCPDITDKPLIVLTSSYSASGSELFAAAIRDHQAGISIGQRTFGKGVAQHVFDESDYPELFDDDCLKVTVYRFFSPDGATNDTMGVLPTLMISAENAPNAALLLSCPQPKLAEGHLKLDLAGQTFYIDLDEAMRAENLPAFTELLEALPSSAALSRGIGGAWSVMTPEKLAQNLDMTIVPRTFSDAADSPYASEINTLACYQLLDGDENGCFYPQAEITRGEFCEMVASALDLPADEKTALKFSDVQAGDTYAGAIGAMADMGFISGDGYRFRPYDLISYQEMVTILANISAWACIDGYDYADMELGGQAVERFAHFASWAQVPARNLELFDALLTEVAPADLCTREVAAASLCRLMDGCGLLWN